MKLAMGTFNMLPVIPSIKVNDLYSKLKDKPSSLYIDYVHLSEDGYQLLGKVISKVIRANL